MEQRNSLRAVEQDALSSAQSTADWLATYLYDDNAEPEELSAVSTQRLLELFGQADETENLQQLKAVFHQLTADQQAAVGLYVAGYAQKAIDTLSEISSTEIVHHIKELNEESISAVKHHRKHVMNGHVYIPLKTIEQIRAREENIDETGLASDRSQIQQLAAEILAARTEWAMQYLPDSSVATWKVILQDWLSGAEIDALAQAFDKSPQDIATRLRQISKVLLREPKAPTRRRGKRNDLQWQAQAKCRDTHDDTFFIEEGKMARDVQEAYCDMCTVRPDCQAYKQRLGNSAVGVWGRE